MYQYFGEGDPTSVKYNSMEKMGKKRFPLWKKMEKIEFPYFFILTSIFKWILYIFFEFYGKNEFGKNRI